MAGKRALIVDDEKLIIKGIRYSLEQDDMQVDCAYVGEEALEYARNNQYDIILLDVMLPKLTGFEVCQQIREFSSVPIIMLTAKGDDMDKILGLEYGADDYITKPFGIEELLARIRCALRYRKKYGAKSIYQANSLKVDFERRMVLHDNTQIHLTPVEYRIVEYLARNSGKVITYQMLLERIWGPYTFGNNKILRVNMTNIRRKIGDNPSEPKYIFTESGVGYRMTESESSEWV